MVTKEPKLPPPILAEQEAPPPPPINPPGNGVPLAADRIILTPKKVEKVDERRIEKADEWKNVKRETPLSKIDADGKPTHHDVNIKNTETTPKTVYKDNKIPQPKHTEQKREAPIVDSRENKFVKSKDAQIKVSETGSGKLHASRNPVFGEKDKVINTDTKKVINRRDITKKAKPTPEPVIKEKQKQVEKPANNGQHKVNKRNTGDQPTKTTSISNVQPLPLADIFKISNITTPAAQV